MIDLPTPPPPLEVRERCYARVGLMGNPSDGYSGKTVSFLVQNFFAEVVMVERSLAEGIELVDTLQLAGLDSLVDHSIKIGYSTGMRLLQATCKMFTEHCSHRGLYHIYQSKGFRMSYDTSIPRMVGLSGSSAIIVAAFRCMLKFYGLTLDDLGITKIKFPEVVLSIEKNELGISAGLQDRVIQTYGGLVHMDFTGLAMDPSVSPYTELSPALLPPMYLAYNTAAGGESGAVHNTVRSRWDKKDPELVEGMQRLDEAVVCLEKQDIVGLATLMERNFATRRALYGDEVVGPLNIRMVKLAEDYGLSAKFTGSGGALLCLRSDGSGWFPADIEATIKTHFQKDGFEFVRIEIPPVCTATVT